MEGDDAGLQQAIYDHALQLGFRLPEDEEFLYLAREALHAPLPEGWQQVTTADAEAVYFFNAEQNVSVWEHPSDDMFRAQLDELRAQRERNRAEFGLSGGREPAGPSLPSAEVSPPSRALSSSNKKRRRNISQSYGSYEFNVFVL